MRTLLLLPILILTTLTCMSASASAQRSDTKTVSIVELIRRREPDPKTEGADKQEHHDVKGVKGTDHTDAAADFKKRLRLNLRKGEYICGENMDRVCRLKPGQVPPGCNGICQYPV